MKRKIKNFTNKTRRYFSQFPEHVELIPLALMSRPQWMAIVRGRLHGESFEDIAQDYNLSRERIKQIEEEAMVIITYFISLL